MLAAEETVAITGLVKITGPKSNGHVPFFLALG